MAGKSNRELLPGKGRLSANGTGRAIIVRLLLLILLAADLLPGQAPAKSGGQAELLPATTGEPLTLVPTDLPDIECAVQEWNPAGPKPVLKLLCPPAAVFAPLRVYLHLSWMKPEEVPADVSRIIARPRGLTKIRTNKSAVMVWLDVAGEAGRPSQARWVGFTGVVDVALIKDSRRR